MHYQNTALSWFILFPSISWISGSQFPPIIRWTMRFQINNNFEITNEILKAEQIRLDGIGRIYNVWMEGTEWTGMKELRESRSWVNIPSFIVSIPVLPGSASRTRMTSVKWIMGDRGGGAHYEGVETGRNSRGTIEDREFYGQGTVNK